MKLIAIVDVTIGVSVYAPDDIMEKPDNSAIEHMVLADISERMPHPDHTTRPIGRAPYLEMVEMSVLATDAKVRGG